jgi:hypothetical protein
MKRWGVNPHTADLLVTGKYISFLDKDKTDMRDGGIAILQDTIVETSIACDLL